MRYLLIQTQDGYWEKPVTGDREYGEESLWRIKDGKQIFCLDEETHYFDRSEDLAVSSGEEADLSIPELKSRLYIRGMQAFFEAAAEEHLYINQRRLLSGSFMLRPGDVLFLKCLKLTVWESEICIQGTSDTYSTVFPEKCRLGRPFDTFPVYKRSPRLTKRLSDEKIYMELPGEKEKQNKKGLLMTVLPPIGMTAVTTVVGVLIGRGIYMLMSVSVTGMTAVLSGVKYLHDKRETEEKNKERERRYLAYMWHKQKEFARAYVNEWEVYDYQYPDIARICEMVKGYDSRIYERVPSDEDFLIVAVGHGRESTCFEIACKEKEWGDREDRLAEIGRALKEKFSVMDKPKIIDLKKAHLGIAGEKELLHLQLKILAVQTAFFQSYHDLQMIVVCDEKYEKEFAWMRWLPHLRIEALNVLGMVCSERTRDMVLGSMSQILKERASRLEEGERAGRFLPHYLFIIDEPSLIMNHPIIEYLEMEHRRLGVSVIYTSYEITSLPEDAGTVLILENSEEGTLLIEEKAYKNQKITLYQMQGAKIEWMARNLSVLEHEQKAAGCIPNSVTFFEMYGVNRPEELEIRKRWGQSQSHKSLAVPLGLRSVGDVLYLNLHEKAHGPHGLMAGTTGAGKSELIQTYILSLAVNFHPQEVGFLLIDYKGGGMAGLFQELPHHLGTITNLDAGGSRRALAAVKAELVRRQKLFISFGVNHINGYMELFKAGKAWEPIPHLFIISDEFAELKKEQPDFMSELVSASRIGRSLGVHLILATQKPAGVVDEQIFSNSRFRICLKVQNENDSREVLRTPDAAAISLPGRAYLQVGSNEVYELFQSALSGAACREEQEGFLDERIYVVNELGQGELINQDLSGRRGSREEKTQLEAVVGHIRDVYACEESVQVRRPWLPPLGEMLVSPYVTEQGEMTWLPQKRQCRNLSVRLGKLDLPEEQRQEDFEHSFIRDGNLLLAAPPGYGKTVFLTTVLISLALLNDVDALNFYILDFGNSGMMPLKALPHTAEYIPMDDNERYQKFKKLMAEEIKSRKRLLADHEAPSVQAYGEITGKPLRSIVVAADQFDVVKEMGLSEEEFFTRLTRDGAGLGIYVAAAASRITSVRLATLNNFKNKLWGCNYDEGQTFPVSGRGAHKRADVKGRVVVSDETMHEMQLYVMAPCSRETSYSRMLKKLIQEIRRLHPGKEAPHIPVLPEEFYVSMVEEYDSDGSDYLAGLDADEVIARGFDKSAGLFVVVGNSGSGKTNLMKVLAGQAACRGRTYIFDSRSMEMYLYRLEKNVLYVDSQKEIVLFLEELSEEIQRRRMLLKKRMEECPELSPKKLVQEMPFCTIFIDDLDDFTGFMKGDLKQAAFLLSEGAMLGIVCILSVHAAKARGMDEVSRMVKQAAEGLVLSDQGVMPVFPVPSIRELPQPGYGLLFKNGIYRRIMIPGAEEDIRRER